MSRGKRRISIIGLSCMRTKEGALFGVRSLCRHIYLSFLSDSQSFRCHIMASGYSSRQTRRLLQFPQRPSNIIPPRTSGRRCSRHAHRSGTTNSPTANGNGSASPGWWTCEETGKCVVPDGSTIGLSGAKGGDHIRAKSAEAVSFDEEDGSG